MKNQEINFDKVIARMKATHPLGPVSKEERQITILEIIKVKNLISGIAYREGLSDEIIRSEMMEAIRASKASPNPQVQELWTTFNYAGEEPTPEEFILWFRDLFLLSLDEKLKGAAEEQ